MFIILFRNGCSKKVFFQSFKSKPKLIKWLCYQCNIEFYVDAFRHLNMTYDIWRLVSPFWYFFSVWYHVGLQAIIVYQRGITLKIKLAKAEKKSENHLHDFLILVVVKNNLYFFFNLLYRINLCYGSRFANSFM